MQHKNVFQQSFVIASLSGVEMAMHTFSKYSRTFNNLIVFLFYFRFSLSRLFFVLTLVHHSFIQHFLSLFKRFFLFFRAVCLFSFRYIRLSAIWSIIQCVFCSIFRNSILYFQSLWLLVHWTLNVSRILSIEFDSVHYHVSGRKILFGFFIKIITQWQLSTWIFIFFHFKHWKIICFFFHLHLLAKRKLI